MNLMNTTWVAIVSVSFLRDSLHFICQVQIITLYYFGGLDNILYHTPYVYKQIYF